MFAEIVQAGMAADEKLSILQRLDIQLLIAARDGIAQDFLHDICGGDDSLRAAKFIHHDGKALGMGEKKLQEVERAHGLGHKGGRNQRFRVVHREIEQKISDIKDPDDLIRRVHIDRNAPQPFLAQKVDRFLIAQVVRQHEGVDPWGHAILGRFVAQLDDFLDHLSFRFVERTFFLAHFDEGLEFLVAEPLAFVQMRGSQQIEQGGAEGLQPAARAIEQRDGDLQGEHADGGKAIGSGEGEQFRDQVAQQNHDGEDDRGRQPLRHARGEGILPKNEETQHDQRNLDQPVAQQEDIKDAARIVAKDLDELGQSRMIPL